MSRSRTVSAPEPRAPRRPKAPRRSSLVRTSDDDTVAKYSAFVPAIALWEFAGHTGASAINAFKPAKWEMAAALLFVDISGFTNLCTRLDLDPLQGHINACVKTTLPAAATTVVLVLLLLLGCATAAPASTALPPTSPPLLHYYSCITPTLTNSPPLSLSGTLRRSSG